MADRIEVYTTVNDTKSEVMLNRLKALNFNVNSAKVVEVYTVNKDFKNQELTQIAEILSNPVSQKHLINDHNQEHSFDFALEIGYLPGVTDNIATTAKETIEDLFKSKFTEEELTVK